MTCGTDVERIARVPIESAAATAAAAIDLTSTFRDDLSRQPPSGRAERRSQRHLGVPAHRVSEQHVGGVADGDQQQQRHGAGQDAQRGGRLRGHDGERHQAQAPAGADARRARRVDELLRLRQRQSSADLRHDVRRADSRVGTRQPCGSAAGRKRKTRAAWCRRSCNARPDGDGRRRIAVAGGQPPCQGVADDRDTLRAVACIGVGEIAPNGGGPPSAVIRPGATSTIPMTSGSPWISTTGSASSAACRARVP